MRRSGRQRTSKPAENGSDVGAAAPGPPLAGAAAANGATRGAATALACAPAAGPPPQQQQQQQPAAAWEKVLWRRQRFPDNYTDPTFLQALVGRAAVRAAMGAAVRGRARTRSAAARCPPHAARRTLWPIRRAHAPAPCPLGGPRPRSSTPTSRGAACGASRSAPPLSRSSCRRSPPPPRSRATCAAAACRRAACSRCRPPCSCWVRGGRAGARAGREPGAPSALGRRGLVQQAARRVCNPWAAGKAPLAPRPPGYAVCCFVGGHVLGGSLVRRGPSASLIPATTPALCRRGVARGQHQRCSGGGDAALTPSPGLP
jgi:hypothetical protein